MNSWYWYMLVTMGLAAADKALPPQCEDTQCVQFIRGEEKPCDKDSSAYANWKASCRQTEEVK